MSPKVFGKHPRVGRGVLVFAAGMAVSGISLLVQAAILRIAKSRG